MVYGAASDEGAPSPSALETIEVRTADGQTLFADVREPETGRARGVAILAHALFARRTEFERPKGRGLAELFCQSGYVTIAFDFRGHGDSGPRASKGVDWSYDDLVRSDLPAVASCAKGRFPALPLIIVGHSLGGHAALAAQGIGTLEADGLVLIAANVWMKHREASRRVWVTKRAVAESLLLVSHRRGYFPARALGLGSDDESARTVASIHRAVRRGRWTSEDGQDDYDRYVSRVEVPVATVTSPADWLNCSPSCGEAMVTTVKGPRLFERVDRCDDGSAAPGHMALVTSSAVRGVYRRVIAWLGREVLGSNGLG